MAIIAPGNFAAGFSGAVSVGEGCGRLINLPAVRLLGAYGPEALCRCAQCAGDAAAAACATGRPDLA
jgi:membrane carboxypeptidase/penicillin-binding protein PbpC